MCLCVFFSFFILSVAHIGRHIGCGTNIHPSTFLITPQAALFMTIDLHCCLQDMERHPQTPMPEEDMVIYYVNRDFAGWVEQHVRRRVYIELKLECTRNRARDVHKARDDWLCLYCRGYYPSKLRLTDHRVRGCPCGPVDSSGSRCELPVYPNLKTTEQGKVFKLILQRGDGFVWNKLHDMSVWLDLNPELKDVIYPPPGAKVQERRFMEPTLETLTACLAPTTKCLPHSKPRASLPPRQYIVPPASPAFVDLQNDNEDKHEIPSSRPNKRTHAQIVDGRCIFHSNRQFTTLHKTRNPQHIRQNVGGDRHAPNSARATPPPRVGRKRPPPHPIRVTPIQSRRPSSNIDVILPPPTPAANVPPDASLPPDTPFIHMKTPTTYSYDMAMELQNDRQTFYMRAASATRGSVKMDNPKPTLRPSIQSSGLFHLMACGLSTFDLKRGEYQAFENEVQKWNNDPAFTDKLFAAYGIFYLPSHQVQVLCFSMHPCLLCTL